MVFNGKFENVETYRKFERASREAVLLELSEWNQVDGSPLVALGFLEVRRAPYFESFEA